MNFGTLLKKYRREHGLTQKELSFIIDTSVQTICIYEKNKGTPKLEQAVDIAKTLGLSLDALTGNCNSSESNTLSSQETEIISEYRKQPDMQKAVCRLLNIDE